MANPDDQQPQSPDLGAAVQLDTADTLDGPTGGDALDAGYVPPDRPYGLDEDGVTGAGMRDGDTLDERLRREQPDELPVDGDRTGRLVSDGQADGSAVDGQGTDVGVDGGAASAEEAAVHDVGDGERPAETEPALVLPADPEADAEVDAAGGAAFDDAARDAAEDPPTGRHALREPADRIDAFRDAAGVSAAASGRDDVGPGSGL